MFIKRRVGDFTHLKTNMKTKIIIGAMIILSAISVWAGVSAMSHYKQAQLKQEIINDLEVKAQPSEIELIEANLEQNRKERNDLQEKIDWLLEQKEALKIEADEYKAKASEILGLN